MSALWVVPDRLPPGHNRQLGIGKISNRNKESPLVIWESLVTMQIQAFLVTTRARLDVLWLPPSPPFRRPTPGNSNGTSQKVATQQETAQE